MFYNEGDVGCNEVELCSNRHEWVAINVLVGLFPIHVFGLQ